jgi:hypothetical protein
MSKISDVLPDFCHILALVRPLVLFSQSKYFMGIYPDVDDESSAQALLTIIESWPLFIAAECGVLNAFSKSVWMKKSGRIEYLFPLGDWFPSFLLLPSITPQTLVLSFSVFFSFSSFYTSSHYSYYLHLSYLFHYTNSIFTFSLDTSLRAGHQGKATSSSFLPCYQSPSLLPRFGTLPLTSYCHP